MTIWITSDSHFGHKNIAEVFTQQDGSRARNVGTVEEMNALMVERWNAVVKPGDHVWHLGDFAIPRWALKTFGPMLQGRKRLIRGNHDIYKTKEYLTAGFEEIRGVSVLDGLLFSHFPVHPFSMGRYKGNVHGHTHTVPDYDERYLNVCVEKTEYRPISLEEVKQWMTHKRDAATAAVPPIVTAR